MTIAVNGLFLTRPLSGTGQYLTHLLTELARRHIKTSFVVFVPEAVEVKLPANVAVEILPPKFSLLGRGLALDRWETRQLPAAVRRRPADLFFTPYPTGPVDLPVPVVMTVHDCIPQRFPQYRRALRSRLKQRRLLAGERAADHLLTVSQTSRRDIVAYAGVPAERITVTYDGVDPLFRKPASAAKVRQIRREHKLSRPYVCYVGGYDYRKNVRRLISGFAKSGLPATHDLVLAGAVTSPSAALYADFLNLPTLLRQAGVHRQTHTIGFVTDQAKRALLAGADAFCYPSLAEGFGLPIIEALAVGTPVAAARIPSTEELFPGSLRLFDPRSDHDLAKVLRQTVQIPDRRLVAAGRKLARQYSWPAAAAKTWRLFADLGRG